MTKKHIKTITIWLIILCISIALIISNFAFYNSHKNDTDIIKINGYTVKNIDVDNLVKNIIHEKQHLRNIDKINVNLKSIIVNNMFFNIQLMRYGLIITNKELLCTLLSMEIFKKNGRFSENLYRDYIKKKRLTEVIFQNEVEKVSVQNRVKDYLKGINNKPKYYSYVIIKSNRYNIKRCDKNFNKNNSFSVDKLSKNFFIEYVDLSVKNIFKNINVNREKINYYKNRINKNIRPKHFSKIKTILMNDQSFKKTLLVTRHEIQNNVLDNVHDNNLIVINGKSFKIIKHKIKTKVILNNDVLNKYKKQKAYNFIKNNNKNLTNKKFSYVHNYLNLELNRFHPIENGIFFNKVSNKVNFNKSGFIKVNKCRYIFFTDKKSNDDAGFDDLNRMMINYLNKINDEQLILNKYLQLKKLKKENKLWVRSFLVNTNKNLPHRIVRMLNNLETKNLILKYKTNYYIVENHAQKTHNVNNNLYLMLKKSINKVNYDNKTTT